MGQTKIAQLGLAALRCAELAATLQSWRFLHYSIPCGTFYWRHECHADERFGNLFKCSNSSGIYSYVRFMRNPLSGFLLCFASFSVQAAHTQARLVLAAESARPGDTVLAGIHLHMEPRWHTYWKNPGASGLAPTNEWQLPSGVTL